jgi:Ca2+-binding RTX toxin-like protein
MAQNSSTNPATGGNTTIVASTGDDQLSGGGGNDTINGLAGNDRLSGDSPLEGQWTYSVYDRNFANAPNQTSLIGDAKSTLVGHGYVDDFNAEDLRNTLGGTSTSVGRNDFGVIYRSGLQITIGGTYTFSTRSDDGSRIIIKDANGFEVFNLNNDDDQGATTVFKSGTLQPGLYTIEVYFWENSGVTAMSGTIAGPGLPQADLATSPLITTPPLVTSPTFVPGHIDGNDSILGDAGNDTITGGGGNDRLFGGADQDSILGEAGRDYIEGGLGNDILEGGIDNDTLVGDGGNDSLYGGAGDDSMDGGEGADFLSGGEGSDQIRGGADNDTLLGEIGDDSLFGGSNDDFLVGGDGNDSLTGDEGNDTAFGSDGNDIIYGGLGNDRLLGDEGFDSIEGGADNDTIFGGVNDDVLFGGTGNDLFGYSTGDVQANNPEIESVFGGGGPGSMPGDFDVLDLSAYGAAFGWVSVVITYAADPENGTVRLYSGIPAPNNSNFLGTIAFEDIEKIIRCFTPGTMILTDRGEVAVEDLTPGDMVMTRDIGLQPLRWIGRQQITRARLRADPDLQPVRISLGALGAEGPKRTMLVSPQHRVLVTGARAELLFGEAEVLVPAKHLIGQAEVTRALPEDGVTYIHILFDRHEIVQSDGIWSESFQPAGQTLSAMEVEVRDEILKIFPDLATDTGAYDCARPSLKAHEARVLFAG